MKVHNKFIKAFGVLLIAALLFGAMPTQAVLAEASEVNPALQAGADRLVALQNDDGGWDWELDDGDPTNDSPQNTIGPIGIGLTEAYLHTGDPDHYAALQKVGTFLLSKTIFSGTDGILAAQLDKIFGVTTYTEYVKANFYDKLANNTYVGSSGTYDTPSYIQAIRNGRSSTQANLAAWDLGYGLVGAAECGVTGSELQYWIDGVKAEINELDDYTDTSETMSYFTLGLAGALYGLSHVNEDLDPTSGYYADATNISELFDGLLAMQNGSGGFVWHPDFTLENDQNENTQVTAYAILALNEYDRAGYLSQILAAADYMLGIQLATGGWDNYPAVGSYEASGENNEVTAEAMWGIHTAYPLDELWVCESGDCGHTGSQFDTIQGAIDAVAPGGTVNVAAGTYEENVIVDKQVSIIGAGSGFDGTVVTTPVSFDAKVGVFQITGSGADGSPLLLQDLRVEPVGQAGISVGRFTEATGQTVEYLKFDNVHVVGSLYSPTTEQERGFYVDLTSTVDHLEIVDSVFTKLTYGWYLHKQVSSDESTVKNVSVTNTTFNLNVHKGIYAEKLSDAVFENCIFDNNGSDDTQLPVYFNDWKAGVDINLKAGDYKNLSFVGSTITNNGTGEAKEGVGLTAKARDDGGYGDFPATLTNVTISGSTITGNERGIRMGEPGKNNAGPSGVVIEENLIYDNVQAYTGTDGSAYGDLINASLTQVDASPNYWGTACEPTTIVGDVIYSPWYMDEAMTMPSDEPAAYVFPTDATVADMNEIIACASDYSTLTFEGGSYPGNIIVPTDRYGLTFKLNNATVGPGSSAFEIYGDAITIEGPGILDGTGDSDSSPAILVDSGVSNFSVSKLEILNWVDGIYYAGEITNTQIVDNYIHDNSGDGVYFTEQPTTETPVSFYIQGNMFKNNGGVGINNAGGTDINAEYNSWSEYAGPTGPDWDGSTNADTNPFTHVDLYMVSTRWDDADEWPNQVFVDDADPLTPYDTITYQVKAHMEKVTGASFVLEFDPNLIEVKDIVNNGHFPWPFNDTEYTGTILDENITYNNTEGWIAFDGSSLTEVYGDIVLFEVTFTGLLPGEVTLNFDETTDEFAMSPSYGPSNNIYADELVDATLNIITRPTLEITGLDTPFVAGVMSHEITNEICNASTGGLWDESVNIEEPYDGKQDAIGWIRISDITLTEIASLQFLYEGVWNDFEVQDVYGGTAVQQDGEDVIARFGNYDYGFEILQDWCDIDKFRVTFVEPGFHDVTVEIYDMMDSVYDGIDPEDILLTSYGPVQIEVLGNFDVTGTIAMQGRTVRSDVPLTLTDVSLVPLYGPNNTTSTSELAYNVFFTGVNGGIYEITTNQPRYLNVTADLDKQISITGGYTMEALELKGGNAVWTDNVINIQDASAVGSEYGSTLNVDADVNFDGKVSIQDLALVGGNFDLTSTDVYGTWTP